MSTWDELKDKASEVAGQVSNKLSEFAETAGTEFKILKIKRAISLLEAEVGEIEQAMGKRVYELHRHKKIEDKELQTRCYEVDGLRKRMDENEDEIEKLRKEAEESGETLSDEAMGKEPPKEPEKEKEKESDEKPEKED